MHMSCLSSVSRYFSNATSFFNPRRATVAIGCAVGAALGVGAIQAASIGTLCLMTLSSAYNLWTHREPLVGVPFTAFPIERGFSAELAEVCGRDMRKIQDGFIRSLFGIVPNSIYNKLHKTFWVPGVIRCIEPWIDLSGSVSFSSFRCEKWVERKTNFKSGINLSPSKLEKGSFQVKRFVENGAIISETYQVVKDPKKGDIVLYFFRPKEGQRIQFEHIGLVSHTTVDEIWVQSKWGELDVFEHLEFAVPLEYGNAVVYLRLVSEDSKSLIKNSLEVESIPVPPQTSP